MAGLKNIKLKIQSVKKTSTVTRAMEAVSAVKMRKAQERALGGRSYAAAALSILSRLSGSADFSRHPLAAERAGKTAVVVITSDKGLAGSLNSGVTRALEAELSMRGLTQENTVIIGIGRRGADYFANRGYSVVERRENVSDSVSEGDLSAITEKLLALHEAGEIGTAIVGYTNFLSTFEQRPVIRQVIPVLPKTVREMVEGIAPVRGKFAGVKLEDAAAVSLPYTIEPDADTVLAALLPKLLTIAVFHALLEAKASEHSARMVAMKSATDKAKEMARDLTRKFNKVRQAAITREVSEITSGMEAMR